MSMFMVSFKDSAVKKNCDGRTDGWTGTILKLVVVASRKHYRALI